MVVENYMTVKVITVQPETSVRKAWDLLQLHQIRHLPVTQDRRLVGIINDRTLRQLLPSSLAPPEELERFDAWGTQVKVGEVMTREVLTVTPQTPTDQAARLMVERRIECMPVLRGSSLVGIIATSDLLRALAGTGRSRGSPRKRRVQPPPPKARRTSRAKARNRPRRTG
jgi:acetoin utilization protein AcuB